MDFDAALKEAQERLDNINREIKLAEWEKYSVEAQIKDQIIRLREQAFGVIGEIAALKKVRDESKADKTV